MDIVLKTIHLYSQNNDTLIHFLTQVFDLDINTGHKEYSVLFNDSLNFTIHKLTKKSKSKLLTIGPFIELKIESNEMLNNLSQKIEFIGYRDECIDAFEIVKESTHLDFKDTDGRLWRLSL
jgi:hypothetical protein